MPLDRCTARMGAPPAGPGVAVVGHAAAALAGLVASCPPLGPRRPLPQKIVTTLRPLLQRLRRAVSLRAAPAEEHGRDEMALARTFSGLVRLPPQLRLELAVGEAAPGWVTWFFSVQPVATRVTTASAAAVWR